MNTGRALLKVLICDDDPQDRKLIRAFLNQQTGWEIIAFEAGQTAEIRAALAKGRLDLVLMDIQMPERSGAEWLREIAGERLAPVVMLTGFGNEEIAVQSLEDGAVGYLPKSGLTAEKLFTTISVAMKKWREGQLIRANQEELERIANLDSLTHIPNRRAVLRKLEDAMAYVRRYHEDLCVIMLDLDNFKIVNDTYGHVTGDDVLEKVASVMRRRLRETDTVGRYGGDEFLIILPKADATAAETAAERLRETLAATEMTYTGSPIFRITVSQGLTCYKPGDDSSSLIARADEALYKAKQNGRNRVATSELADETGPAASSEIQAVPEPRRRSFE